MILGFISTVTTQFHKMYEIFFYLFVYLENFLIFLDHNVNSRSHWFWNIWQSIIFMLLVTFLWFKRHHCHFHAKLNWFFLISPVFFFLIVGVFCLMERYKWIFRWFHSISNNNNIFENICWQKPDHFFKLGTFLLFFVDLLPSRIADRTCMFSDVV